jgi:3'-phosphoadenosine 5'-phosphosulfate sulfotransferase (PAPS reductase)/FAD synthetase
MKQIKNLISFSGGKDSTALILWAKENLDDFDVIFCETFWDNQLTYDYIDHINKSLLNDKLIVLKSSKYQGFADMCIKKKRAPSAKARFCTEALKLKPVVDYIHNELSDFEVHLYNGIRRDESLSRSKKEEMEFDGKHFNAWIHRPLLYWSVDDVFNIHKKHNVEPNPLYKLGFGRVGCMPCIMSRNSDIKLIAKYFPEDIEKVRILEKQVGCTFFGSGKIPERFRKSIDEKTQVKIAFVDNIIKYVEDDPNQEELFEPNSCMSKYNICE